MAVIIVVLIGCVLRIEIRAMRNVHRASIAAVQSAEASLRSVQPSEFDDLFARTATEIAGILDVRVCWFESFPFATLLPRIEADRVVLPPTEPGVAPWSDAGVELPIRLNELTLGRFVLIPRAPTVGVAFSPSTRAQALTHVARLAAPLASIVLADDRERLAKLAEPLYEPDYEAAVALSAHGTRATSAHNRSRS